MPTLSVSRSARCCAQGPGHSDFLDLYLTNGLVEGTLEVLGTPVDLGKVMCDSFVVAGYTDRLIHGTAPSGPSSCWAKLMHARRSRPPTVWGYASQLFAAAGWTSLPWLHRIAAPTLVLTGEKDPIVPPINARILGARIPQATVHVVPDASHLLLMDHAVDSAELITRFLPSDEPDT